MARPCLHSTATRCSEYSRSPPGGERDAEQPLFSLDDDGGLSSWITRAAFSPGNQFLAVSTDRTAYVAELSTGTERFSTPSVAMAFTPDGRSLAVATPGKPEMTRLADAKLSDLRPDRRRRRPRGSRDDEDGRESRSRAIRSRPSPFHRMERSSPWPAAG